MELVGTIIHLCFSLVVVLKARWTMYILLLYKYNVYMSPFKKLWILKKNSSNVWFSFKIFSSSFFSSSVSWRALEVSAIQDTPNKGIKYSGTSGLEDLKLSNYTNTMKPVEDTDLIILAPPPAWRDSTQILLLSASSLMVIFSTLSAPLTSLDTAVTTCPEKCHFCF